MSSASGVSPAEELAEFLARRPSLQEIASFQLSAGARARAQELMDKNTAGRLTPEEERELDRLVLLDDVIGLIQTHIPAPDADTAADESRPHGA